MKQNKHLPEFLRDFHDQKNFSKAFRVFLFMQNKKRNGNDDNCLMSGKGQDGKPLFPTPSWIVIHLLLLDFLDFMNYYGYRLYRSRDKNNTRNENIYAVVEKHKELGIAWLELLSKDSLYSQEYCLNCVSEFENVLDFMPQGVKERYLQLKEEGGEDDSPS